MTLVKVSSPRIATSEASHWTVRRRTHEMSAIRDSISGGAAAAQLQDELSLLSETDRSELLDITKCPPVELSSSDTLAMKADLVLPWNKMRIMRRYTHVTCHCMFIYNYTSYIQLSEDG